MFTIIALGIMALSISLLVRHPDDFAPRACGRCRRFVRVLEVPFAKTESLERLKQAVEAAEIDGLASLAATPVPTGGRHHWVCLRLEACPTCADRARVTLVDLPRERVLAGPRATPKSPSDLIAAGARRRERAQPYVDVRLLS